MKNTIKPAVLLLALAALSLTGLFLTACNDESGNGGSGNGDKEKEVTTLSGTYRGGVQEMYTLTFSASNYTLASGENTVDQGTYTINGTTITFKSTILVETIGTLSTDKNTVNINAAAAEEFLQGTWKKEDGNPEEPWEWPDTLKFWLVHEMYTDTQRLTKMIIDAGKGFSFNSSDIDKGNFKAHFEATHWHAEYNQSTISLNHKYANQNGNVGQGYRTIDDAYVIDDLSPSGANFDIMERRDLNTPQSKLEKVSKGRYLVLEFYSERKPEQSWSRTAGAESGWNSHNNRMMQDKHDYRVEQQSPFKIYHGETASPEETTFKYQKYDKKWNDNEIVDGEIQILLNKFQAKRYDANEINYRLYVPRGTGAKPLYIWLHGSDGSRIVDGTNAENPDYWGGNENIPEFLQNHGQLTTGPGQMVNKAHQEKYGGYYVLAPQANQNEGHRPVNVKGIIDELIRDYSIDTSRIYVSGHSMGGAGTLAVLIAYPNLIAAAMPAPGSVSLGGDPSPDDLAKLTNTPLWLFTIRGDSTNMDSQTITLYNGIRNTEGGDNVRMTYYPVNGYSGSFPNGSTTPSNVGSGGYSGNDPIKVPGGTGWGHSAYEPAMSDLEKTNGSYNVGFTNTDNKDYTGAGDRASYVKFEWGYKHPKDQADYTTFQWIFSWRRNNQNSNSTVDRSSTTTTTMVP
jgi:predicted peptidase